MAYKYETQYNSPNYTPANRAQATWGQPRTIAAIAIHWWGDPNTGPTYEGVIATLCNPNRGASAHFVATGTGRRVACLVSPADASWATNSANPYTISIECDPRCREEDYDVVAELIASIRSAYGDLPLVPHKQFVATACPGNYNLGELDRRARLKDGSGDWGDVKDKDNEVKIGSEPNWRARFNKLHHQLVGNWDMSDDVFKSIVGQDAWKVIESWSDHPSAGTTQAYQEIGQRAEQEHWQQQIGERTAERDDATKKLADTTTQLSAKDLEIERLNKELENKAPESPSTDPKDPNGTTNPSNPQSSSQSLSEWLGEVFEHLKQFLSKFKRSK